MIETDRMDHEHTEQRHAGRVGVFEVFGVYDFVKVALLMGLGYYFAEMVVNGSLKNYTNQPEWLALITSGMFALLGIATAAGLVRSYRESAQQKRHAHHEHGGHKMKTAHVRDEHDHAEDAHGHGHGHSHAHISWAVIIIVALPLVLGKIVPSKPLGAAAITTDNLATSNLAVDRTGQITLDPPDWNIMEWKLAFQHLMHPQEWFNGQKADVVAFVVHTPDAPSGHFVGARFVMYHCAADARGVGLLVKWPGSDQLAQDAWVRVKGTIRVQDFNGDPVLVLDATQVDKVSEPETPYLRPVMRDSPVMRDNAGSGG